MSQLIKKLHHENWPTFLFYIPVAIYYLYTSLRLRKLNYFTAVNPAMKTGGLCGFSKYDSFESIPSHLLPETFLIRAGDDLESYQDIEYPRVLKPDQGERGFLVSKVESFGEVSEIIKEHPDIDFLLQEFIDDPLELGVFLIREKTEWKISSITSKKFLTLTGDGFSTLEQLASKDAKAREFLNQRELSIDSVLAKDEVLILEPIGNHCRGTEFINACDHISPNLVDSFKEFLDSLEGINYCRLDLKTKSWEELEKGHYKIMEINGVSAEPGHIYDPQISLRQAYKDLFFHWRSMTRIAELNLSQGESFKETLNTVKDHMSKKKRVHSNKKHFLTGKAEC